MSGPTRQHSGGPGWQMFVQVAEVVGEAYGLEPIQPPHTRSDPHSPPVSPAVLDLLVRDWSSSWVLQAQGGEQHLRHVRQMLAMKSPCKHPKALEVLSRSSSRCYLMPFPGERIAMGSKGRLRDMDEDFRESLRDYVTALVSLAGQHVQTDRHGEMLTGTQLAAKIKNLSDVMKKHRFGFSSPCQMAITFHNQRVLDIARADHAVFLREMNGLSQRMVDCLKVDPSAMAEQVMEQRRTLLERCWEEMKELEETLLRALEAELIQEPETFLETYGKHYRCHVISQGAMDRARRDHADFLREKDGLSRRMIDCLTVGLSAMEEQFAEQFRLLLGRCWEELNEPEETLLTALEAELIQDSETFLETYGRRYRCHATNQRVMDRARRDHADFLREKDALSRLRIDDLIVDPSAMAEQFQEKRRSLLERCREELKEPAETLLRALEAELTQEAETFLETHGKRYQCHITNESARKDYAAFLKKTNMLTSSQELEARCKKLLERCRRDMLSKKEFPLTDLDAALMWEKEDLLRRLDAELTRMPMPFQEANGKHMIL
ncbi:hypothetical protein UY3_02012 [Chelonia mydas]|uniref:Uncharacterized protein n=1 Tax=Chelonia mydas TaxID=8469 RepID=M7BS90_CHEMY|nr:hypothetical protein UY3_02012 [Chelonia mydas]